MTTQRWRLSPAWQVLCNHVTSFTVELTIHGSEWVHPSHYNIHVISLYESSWLGAKNRPRRSQLDSLPDLSFAVTFLEQQTVYLWMGSHPGLLSGRRHHLFLPRHRAAAVCLRQPVNTHHCCIKVRLRQTGQGTSTKSTHTIHNSPALHNSKIWTFRKAIALANWLMTMQWWCEKHGWIEWHMASWHKTYIDILKMETQ